MQSFRPIIITIIFLLSFLLTSCENQVKEGIMYLKVFRGSYEWVRRDIDNVTIRKYKGELKSNFFGNIKYFNDIGLGKEMPHGKGTYYHYGYGWQTKNDEIVFVGEFRDGKKFQGTQTWPDGLKYEGEFKNVFTYKPDSFHGQGTMIWPDGKKYIGQWKDGKFHGQGTMTWPDGSKYVGEFLDWAKSYKIFGMYFSDDPRDNYFHGHGTFIFPDGRKYVGEFQHNYLHNIKYYGKDGEIIREWINGEKVY